jgi:hypothetical protein
MKKEIRDVEVRLKLFVDIDGSKENAEKEKMRFILMTNRQDLSNQTQRPNDNKGMVIKGTPSDNRAFHQEDLPVCGFEWDCNQCIGSILPRFFVLIHRGNRATDHSNLCQEREK